MTRTNPGTRIYFDWNATTRPRPAVVEAMTTVLRETWGNPASAHTEGRAARRWIEEARQEVALLARAHPLDVVLTSGGTEATNMALWSAFAGDIEVPTSPEARPEARAEAARAVGNAAEPMRAPSLLLGAVEHPSVVSFARWLGALGIDVRWVRVSADARLDLEDLRVQLKSCRPRLVAVQAASGETGVVQPLREVRALASEAGAKVHVDVVQALGRGVEPEGGYLSLADSLTLAAHKIEGPKGIGALVTRPRCTVVPLLRGGSQERNLRPGTQDPVAAAGFAVAARLARQEPRDYESVRALRDELEQRLVGLGAIVHGREPRLAHVTFVSIPGWASAELVAALDLEGLAVSGGPACSSGKAEGSDLLEALYPSPADRALREGALRLSLPPWTTRDDADRAGEILSRVLRRHA